MNQCTNGNILIILNPFYFTGFAPFWKAEQLSFIRKRAIRFQRGGSMTTEGTKSLIETLMYCKQHWTTKFESIF